MLGDDPYFVRVVAETSRSASRWVVQPGNNTTKR